MKEIYLAGAVRTPIGSFLGSLSGISAVELGAMVIKEALNRSGIPAEAPEDLIFGCVLQGGLGQNVARQALLKAGIPEHVPAQTVNMVCGSGLRAVIDAARIIECGDADIVVAGGTESMSQAPYVLSKARSGYRMGDGELRDMMILDGLFCACGQYHMGLTAENVAAKYNISRQEQDEFAAKSQQKAAKAIESGLFEEEILPVTIPQKKGDPVIVSKDEHPRPSTSAESLAKLRPAFKEDGSVTAGNASGINDGAAAMVVLSENAVKKYGVKPLAKITAWSYAGVDPSIMGVGPVEAITKILKKSGKTLNDIDLIEANEAFAAQAVAVGKEAGWFGTVHENKVNVSGGAIALGHPIGASGARILTTLLYEMKRRESKTGLATLCIGGGMGVSLMVERMKS